MLPIHEQIRELRAELACCALTRRERTRAEAELERLCAEEARLSTAIADDAPPG
jgi:hypothetical protein